MLAVRGLGRLWLSSRRDQIHLGDKLIAPAGHGLDVARLIDLFIQGTAYDRNGSSQRGLGDLNRRPDAFQQLGLRDDPLPMGDQECQHVERFRTECHDLTATSQLVSVYVELELTESIAHEEQPQDAGPRMGLRGAGRSAA